MSAPWNLEGVEEKLARAKENIVNLTAEIDTFLGPEPSRIVTKENHDAVKEFIDTHLARKIPPRFSVLAAECIHNLRSCLDQIAWQLVLANNRVPDDTRFPLLINDPAGNEKLTASYRRAVKGMSDTAKAYILGLQPYQPGQGGKNHILRILHDLNITDKHHALVVVSNAFYAENRFKFTTNAVGLIRAEVTPPREDGTITFRFNQPMTPVDVENRVTVQVTFPEFGAETLVPIPEALWDLWKATNRVLSELLSIDVFK